MFEEFVISNRGQTITELAVEQQTPVSTDELRTLNLCLDDAIAGAVTEFARLRVEAPVSSTAAASCVR